MERIGVAFSGGMSPPEIVECVQLAEELGYESAWMAEGHGGDQFSILTACALSTKTILLGTSISSVFVRSAPTIAMAAASVDHFSGGRFILGLGSSHRVQVEPEHGLTFSDAIPRLRECVDIVRALLRDGRVSHSGRVFDIQGFDLWFEPLRREIPIYLAGVFPKMLEICGEIAQGAILTWSTLEHVRKAAQHVSDGAQRAGRSPQQVDLATLVSCIVSDDLDEARQLMRPSVVSYVRFPRYGRLMAEAGFPSEVEAMRRALDEGDRERALKLVPDALIEAITLVGGPDRCRQRLQEYREAGITVPVVVPRTSGDNAKATAMETIRACAPEG